MWPQWLSSPSRSEPKSRSPPLDFRCSSFKDIDSLFREDSDSRFHHQKKPSVFHRVRISTAVLRSRSSHRPSLADGDQRVVLYFTSLRVVRRTYEDCRTVRSILRGLRVPIDERDVSMDLGFLKEVKGLTLPRVFVGGSCVGGADEIRELHECGELRRLIGRFPAAETGGCEACGGHRFVVCDECSGSHKVYLEKSGFRVCSACNVNGLIRCPHCFSDPLIKLISAEK